jgi:FAD/FMN-containing dehydrogenase
LKQSSLEETLTAIVGSSHLLTRSSDLSAFEQDTWQRYRGKAAFVARPGSTQQVADILHAAARHGASVVPQGGNTGLVAGGIPDSSGREIVLSLSRMNRIRTVEPLGEFAVAEAGVVLADLQKAAENVGRFFPLSLGAEGSCQIGGNIATNAGGLNVVRYGMMRGLVLGLEVVLPDGTIWNGLRSVRKDNTGYDLKQLFIGSEGTLGIVTAASLKLMPPQRERQTIWMSVPALDHALQLFERFRAHFGDIISSFELLHSNGVELAVAHLVNCRRPVEAPHPWHVLIELAWALPSGLRDHAERLLEDLFETGIATDGSIAESEAQRLNMWKVREGQSEAARSRGVVLRSDVSVSIELIPTLLAAVEKWVDSQESEIIFMPFGHIGDGNIHCNCVVAERQAPDIEPRFLAFLFQQVSTLGGSISAEHGVGRLKTDAVWMRKPQIEWLLSRAVKDLLDPSSTLNPGVIFGKPGTSQSSSLANGDRAKVL